MNSNIFKYIVRPTLGILGFVLIIVLLLHTNWGLNRVAKAVISRLDVFNNASLSVKTVEGSPFSHLSLHGLKLISSHDSTLVEIESVQIGYYLLPMLKGEFHFSDLTISSPQIKITQHQDLSWDLFNIVEPDTSSSPLILTLSRLSINDGSVQANSFSETRDSTYQISALNIQLSKLALDGDISGVLDELKGEIWIPHADDPVHLTVAAAYDGKSLRLDSLSLRSENSYVDGQGRLLLSATDSLLYNNELTLKAAPLAFDDIRLFVPGLASGQYANIDLKIGGEKQILRTFADVNFSDGASINFQGLWDKEKPGIGNIDVAGNFSNFNPNMVTGEPNLDGLLNAEITAELTGSSLELLSGTSLIHLYSSEINGHPLDSTIVEVIFDKGRAKLSLHTGLYNSNFSLAGFITPFTDKPTYDFKGRLTQFNLDPFLEGDFESNLNAIINLNGEGYSLDKALTSLLVQVQPSNINQYDISTGELSAQIGQKQIAHSVSISGQSGGLTSEGLTSVDKTTIIEHLNLSLQQFDVAALMGDTLQSAITGNTHISGKITEPGEVEASLQSEFEQAKFRHYDLRRASLIATWKNNQIELSSAGNIDAGSFNVEGVVRLEEKAVAYEITKGNFNNLNIGSFLLDSKQESELNGSFFLLGNGFDPASLSLSGQVELASSRINQQLISSASTWFSLQSDTLNFDLNFDLPEGTSSLAGQIAPLNEAASYQITKGTLSGIDVGKLTGVQGLSTELNGAFLLSGNGTKPATMTARADLIIEPSRINQVAVREGKTTFYLASNTFSLFSTIAFEKGGFALEAEASSVSDDPAYQFKSTIEGLDIARLLGSDSTTSLINLNLSGKGKGLNPKIMSLASQVAMNNSVYEDILLDTLRLDVNLEKGLLTVDTLLVVSNITHAFGNGPIALFDDEGDHSSAFTLKTQLLNLEPLESLLDVDLLRAQSGELNTRIFGRQGALRMDTKVHAGSFVYDAFHLGELDARVTGEFDANRSFTHADITGQVTAVSIPGFVFEEINLEATYDSTEVHFTSNGRLDRERGAQVSGSLFFEPDGQRLQLDLINLNLDEDQWQLDQPATIKMGPHYRVDNFLMKSGSQHIALEGIIDLEGQQDLQLDVKNFGVGTVADLLGFKGLDGPITSHIDLQGPAEAPTISGNLDMQLIAFEKEAGDLSINVAYDSLQLKLEASLTQELIQSARLNGVLPIDLSLTTPEASTSGAGLSQNVAMEGSVDFSIDADSMAVEWILPFIDPTLLNRLEGILTAHIKIGGTAQDPTLEGAGRLVDGKIRSPLLGVTYEGVESDISLSDNVIELTNAEMRSGEGSVSGNGSIELSDLTSALLDINVTASEFLAIHTREYRATASGNMDLTGTLTSPVLKGDVTVLSADMYLNESSKSELADLNVQLTEADLLMLEREFGIRASAADTTTFDFLEALRMDMEILFERDVWIRSKKNPEMNIQFSGELDVSKAPFDEYSAFGNIELIPDRSYINQFGKRFDITLGNLTFNGPATDPQLDFEALYEVPARRSQENAVTIYMDAEGQLEDLDLTLRADPTMELTDILSYIATGQPASEALQLGGTDNQSLASTGAGFALNQGVGLLTGAIESLIQDSGLELDVIQIEPLANAKGATITAGKYVTPRIFTAVSQPIGASDSDGTSTREESTVITLELELVDSLLLRLLGGESVLQINLLWHHSY